MRVRAGESKAQVRYTNIVSVQKFLVDWLAHTARSECHPIHLFVDCSWVAWISRVIRRSPTWLNRLRTHFGRVDRISRVIDRSPYRNADACVHHLNNAEVVVQRSPFEQRCTTEPIISYPPGNTFQTHRGVGLSVCCPLRLRAGFLWVYWFQIISELYPSLHLSHIAGRLDLSCDQSVPRLTQIEVSEMCSLRLILLRVDWISRVISRIPAQIKLGIS